MFKAMTSTTNTRPLNSNTVSKPANLPAFLAVLFISYHYSPHTYHGKLGLSIPTAEPAKGEGRPIARKKLATLNLFFGHGTLLMPLFCLV